jgi:hypothetical protein
LTNLEALELTTNHLTGSFPLWLNALNRLRELRLDDNQLDGSIPAEIGTLRNLEILDLGQNGFSGTIPNEIANLTKLLVIGLYANKLAGDLPSDFWRMKSLKEIWMSRNELTGAIGWVNCSKPPPEWKPCPDVISEWALAGARPPCGGDAGTDALTGECSRSVGKGPTPTCAFGEICDFAGCSAGDSGRTGVPCGAIRCGSICECVPETSQCRCVAP